MSEIKDVIVQGLWKNNSALVQLLGLCPLLAVTSTATNALGLGLATTLVLTLTNLTISTLPSLDARRDPHSHLRDDHRLGGQRCTDADQRLRLLACINH